MSDLAPTLQAFFTERLIGEGQASPHTIASYRDTFRILLKFVQAKTGKAPARLDLADLGAPIIGEFLDHLERDRANSASTRNVRLAAVHSLFRYATLRHPEHAELIQRVLAVPPKRVDRALVSFLTRGEVDALLAAPDRTRWEGRRDHALLLVAVQTGLRVSELCRLSCGDVELGRAPYVRCHGKGRKERVTPLTKPTVATLKVWLAERNGQPRDALFPSRRRRPLSRDAVELLVARHASEASRSCPSLKIKDVTPHVLRHTAAMLLRAGVDITVIALWLGHESVETTQIYLHADLTIKEKALARTAPSETPPGRYRPPDTLIAFLEAL